MFGPQLTCKQSVSISFRENTLYSGQPCCSRSPLPAAATLLPAAPEAHERFSAWPGDQWLPAAGCRPSTTHVKVLQGASEGAGQVPARVRVHESELHGADGIHLMASVATSPSTECHCHCSTCNAASLSCGRPEPGPALRAQLSWVPPAHPCGLARLPAVCRRVSRLRSVPSKPPSATDCATPTQPASGASWTHAAGCAATRGTDHVQHS